MSEPVEFTSATHRRAVHQRIRSTSELGAARQFHATCPCCNLVFEIDHTTAEQSMLDRDDQTLKKRVQNRIQEYFTNCWKWKTIYRPVDRESGPHRKKGVRSTVIEMVWNTGVGKALRRVYKTAIYRKQRRWFAVLWHDAPTIGEQFFCCLLGDLFQVLQGIADDSPEFAYRLRTAADNALKRDGSMARRGRDGEFVPEGSEGGGEAFDPSSAVSL